jgi:5-formyltetrahydrofolate cyclo-ligase
VDTDKVRLRSLWRARLAEARGTDEALAAALDAWARPFEAVLATLPLRDEPDLTMFYRRWLAEGRRLALSRISDGRLEFVWVTDVDGPWETTAQGLREPPAAPAWVPGPKTLVLVPGLAFAPAPDGVVRLGRGGGWFDRWLAVHRSAVTTLGVGFPFQLTDTLPREPHDIPLNGYLDSQGFHGLEPK